MSAFPHNYTPKPRALTMLLLGVALTIVGFLGMFLLPPLMLFVIPGAALAGWFGMEYFFGEGPR